MTTELRHGHKHTSNLARAKTLAINFAHDNDCTAHVVAAPSGFYVGYYPNADAMSLVYIANPRKKRVGMQGPAASRVVKE